jgi:hypothetical protein
MPDEKKYAAYYQALRQLDRLERDGAIRISKTFT